MLGVFVMNHIVDALIKAGFDKTQVRKHRVFSRAAVIAKAADAVETLMVSPPLEDEEYWAAQTFALAPTEIRNDLPDDHMIVWDKRPRSFWEVKKIVFDFLK